MGFRPVNVPPGAGKTLDVFASKDLERTPRDYRRVTAALDLGQPILTDSPNSPARLAIRDMARQLAGDAASGQAADTKLGGLLGRLWKRDATTKQPVG